MLSVHVHFKYKDMNKLKGRKRYTVLTLRKTKLKSLYLINLGTRYLTRDRGIIYNNKRGLKKLQIDRLNKILLILNQVSADKDLNSRS